MRINGRAAERLEFSPTPSEDVRMRFTVRHETIYRYSAPVSLSPHLLRLNPRAEGATILERSLTVDPKPIAFREETDRFGNRVTHLDFEGFSDRLRIESRFDLETVAPEPFAGLGALPLPWAEAPTIRWRSIAPARLRSPRFGSSRRPSLPRAGGRLCSFSTASTGRFSPG